MWICLTAMLDCSLLICKQVLVEPQWAFLVLFPADVAEKIGFANNFKGLSMIGISIVGNLPLQLFTLRTAKK